MFNALPKTAQEFMTFTWAQIEPYYADLEARALDAGNVNGWLTDWTRLSELLDESYNRLYIATTLDTTDTAGVERFHAFLHDIWEPVQPAEQRLKQKLLDSGLEPEGFEIPLRNMRSEAALFREENVPLFTHEQELTNEYDKIIGAQTIQWEGQELTLPQLKPIFQDTDREVRAGTYMALGIGSTVGRPPGIERLMAKVHGSASPRSR